MEKDTIMPDGRPIWAWENELSMLREEHKRIKAAKEEMATFIQLMGIIWNTWKEPATLDWHFRVSVMAAVSAEDFHNNLEKYLQRV